MTREPTGPWLSVIITGRRPVADLRSFVAEILDAACGTGRSTEVIVVAQTDAEPTSFEGTAVTDGGQTLTRCVRQARGEFVVFIDAEGGYSPTTPPALIAPLAQGACDLAVATPDPGAREVGRAAVARRVASLITRAAFWPLADGTDPSSGCYGVRRDRLMGLERPGSPLPVDLPSILVAAGPDLRIAEVPAPGCGVPSRARRPGLSHIFGRLRPRPARAETLAPTGARRWIAGAAAVAIDLATTLSMLLYGASHGASSIMGFLAGCLVWLAVAAPWSRGAMAIGRSPWRAAARLARSAGVSLLALGLRGGVIASAVAYGSPDWLAVTGGVGLCWIACHVGNAFYAAPPAHAEQPVALRWTLAAVGIVACALLLRIVYLKVFTLMPEEAYYWMYSTHLDLGYLDHPPLVAVLIALSEALFGHGEASVRIPSLLCGLVLIIFVYRLARRLVDRPSAMVAAALTAVLPYYFVGAGVLVTPDAPLAAAWATSLYFFHRALVGDDRAAWYGVGVGLGLGLLSKYTVALLGPAALVFCVLDARARRWLLRPEPYVAAVVALAVFAPVIYWNYGHEWASFRYQAGGRYGAASGVRLHRLLANVLLVATPLPLLALPLLFRARWTGRPDRVPEPAHAHARNRLFVGCFVFVPLAVFSWNALQHSPRLNWTGPVWLATLPLIGWMIVRGEALRAFGLGAALRAAAGGLLPGLLVAYAIFAYHIVLGIPGLPYPTPLRRAMGWSEVARHLHVVQARVARTTGAAPVIAGMDKYFIASELAFYGTPEYLASARGARADGAQPDRLEVTAIGQLFGGDALMFGYWDPPENFRGRTVIMVARRRSYLTDERVSPYFRALDADIHSLPLINAGYAGNRKRVHEHFYRIGRDFQPAPTSASGVVGSRGPSTRPGRGAVWPAHVRPES